MESSSGTTDGTIVPNNRGEKNKNSEKLTKNKTFQDELFPTDEEEEAVNWADEGEEDEEARVELGLVGRIWTKRRINANAFMETIKAVWQPNHGVEISSMGDNTFVFQFHHWRDKNKVVEGQPWHFDNHAILLGDIDGNIKPSDMELCTLPMWVRVYNLPFKGRLNMMNVEAIGKKIGQFVKMDASGSVGIDKSIRLRVNVDVRKPLLKAVKVKMRGGVEEFFDVKYERPPIFCYLCGKLGHGVKDCNMCGDEVDPPMNYGGWLKASPWRRGIRGGEQVQDEESSSCARKLFVTKPKEPSKKVTQQVLSLKNLMTVVSVKRVNMIM